MHPLKFLSRHEPTNGQQSVAQKLGYTGLEKIDLFFSEDPLSDLQKAGIFPQTWEEYWDDQYSEWLSRPIATTIAGVFPLVTALTLLRAGFELVIFTNSRDARDASKFVCTGADVLTLSESRHISLSADEITAANDVAVDSRLFIGSRAIEGGAK